MKIAFFENKEEEEINFFKQKLTGHELVFSDNPLSSDNLPADRNFELLVVFITSKIDANLINALPNLKAIFVRATGFDNIDIELCKQKNIVVANVPAYGSHTVAEFTFALILSLVRKVYTAVNRVKIGERFSFEGLCGMELFGKTLGVVGTGKIGGNVIRIAKGFGMNILGFDAYPNPELATELDFKYVGLEELLKSSDIVTLHTPYSSETHHLLNSTNIPTMKEGSFLINTARGAVVETDGLLRALTNGPLAGAGLDVLEEEIELKEEAELLSKNAIPEEKYKEILEDHMLINNSNVLVTPHMAFFTKEAVDSIRQTTVDNINSFLSGTPQNQVNI